MKIRIVTLWTIVLVVIEQVIKLIISTNYRDINFEIIPSLFEFKPILNDKSFYWLSLMNIEVGRWARLATGIILLGILCLYYLCMKTISKKENWLMQRLYLVSQVYYAPCAIISFLVVVGIMYI